MRLYIDLDKLSLVQSATDNRTVNRLSFKRGDGAEMELVFLRNSVPTRLAVGSTITFCCKTDGRYDGEPLILHSGFIESAVLDPDSDPHYAGSPSFNTSELNTALAALDADDTNDIRHIDLMAEVSWKTASTDPTSTKTFTARVDNDVIRGDEGNPTEIPSAEDWLAERAQLLKLDVVTYNGIVPLESASIGKLVYIPAGYTEFILPREPNLLGESVWFYSAGAVRVASINTDFGIDDFEHGITAPNTLYRATAVGVNIAGVALWSVSIDQSSVKLSGGNNISGLQNNSGEVRSSAALSGSGIQLPNVSQVLSLISGTELVLAANVTTAPNSGILTDVAGLKFSNLQPGTYCFEAEFFIISSTFASTGTSGRVWFSGTATGRKTRSYYSTAGTEIVNANTTLETTTNLDFFTAFPGRSMVIKESGIIVVTGAGDLSVQVAQQTAGAGNLTVAMGSRLKLTKK